MPNCSQDSFSLRYCDLLKQLCDEADVHIYTSFRQYIYWNRS